MRLQAAVLALFGALGGAMPARARPVALTGPDQQRAVARLRAVGVHPAIAQLSARHVLFGLPSGKYEHEDKQLLLARNGYVISYNGDRNAMNWASWAVEKTDLAPRERTPGFRPDPTLPRSFYRPSDDDFKIPGFSRGHMVRSGERTSTARANSKTYVYPNLLVQAQNNNTGPWNGFENYYLDHVENQGLVAHVIAGGVFGAPPAPQRGVAVPSATWKIVALLRPGQSLAEVGSDTRVVSVLIPNNNDDVKVEQNWDRYRVSVAEIEKQTGLRFFDHLPDPVADQLRVRVDGKVIPPPPPSRFEQRNYVPPIASRVAGELAWFDAVRGFGFIKRGGGKPDVFVHAKQLGWSVAKGERLIFDIVPSKSGREQAIAVGKDKSEVTDAGATGAPGAVVSATQPVLQHEAPILESQVAGTLVRFDPVRGFGFIKRGDGRPDVFVHATQLDKAVAKGDRVLFDIRSTSDGRVRATAVRGQPVVVKLNE